MPISKRRLKLTKHQYCRPSDPSKPFYGLWPYMHLLLFALLLNRIYYIFIFGCYPYEDKGIMLKLETFEPQYKIECQYEIWLEENSITLLYPIDANPECIKAVEISNDWKSILKTLELCSKLEQRKARLKIKLLREDIRKKSYGHVVGKIDRIASHWSGVIVLSADEKGIEKR